MSSFYSKICPSVHLLTNPNPPPVLFTPSVFAVCLFFISVEQTNSFLTICIFLPTLFTTWCRWKMSTSTQSSSPSRTACWLQLSRPRGPSSKLSSSHRSTNCMLACNKWNKPPTFSTWVIIWFLGLKYSCVLASEARDNEILLNSSSCRTNIALQPGVSWTDFLATTWVNHPFYSPSWKELGSITKAFNAPLACAEMYFKCF